VNDIKRPLIFHLYHVLEWNSPDLPASSLVCYVKYKVRSS